MAVQYVYRLGVTAVTDVGSPEGVTLQDRYAAILQYQQAWTCSNIPQRMQDPAPGSHYLAHSNGVFVYAVQDSANSLALKLHRPGSACTGLPELTFLCSAWKSMLDPISLFSARFTVNLSEDLLVITRLSDDRTEYLHHFVSISRDCYPHPVAAPSILRAPRRTRQRHAITYLKEGLDILSDLVAWGHRVAWGNIPFLFDDEEYCYLQPRMEVLVRNWKTGAVVWRYQSNQIISYHLIDRHHILITQHDGIHVFALDPDHSEPEPPVYTMTQAELLHLRVPTFKLPAVQRAGLFKSFLDIPRNHPDDRPLIRPDPAHSLLAMCMPVHVAIGSEYDKIVQTKSLVFLVSLATIRGYLARRHSKTGSAQLGRSLVLSWDDWGPAGARVVTADNVDASELSIATHGSRCVLTILSTPLNVANLVLIDAHPWAQQFHSCGQSVTLQTLRQHDNYGVKVVDSTDVHSMLTLSTSERPRKTWKPKSVILEGRFPCWMAWYTAPLETRYRNNHTVLTGEEVVIVRKARGV
ncbi:hypothetical protein L226DRAFT_565312 [Lentinus tigrinus ALCF2SS1-7]|uniref:Uncharacterized protein n=1 Tax=Lentinus tigrinus ALCF2SS1-6 TaxID=1328759 RepID=A0A5C2SNJ1_9APHY|nr:hypothetical protein L227DRAFT_607356 [Lentinus tigrinus ALCF2SS1-6]RPD82781.1 hypothetical protein L226DRAFT_565312 [Lentinus tigrinus ALCF2SS1-7]